MSYYHHVWKWPKTPYIESGQGEWEEKNQTLEPEYNFPITMSRVKVQLNPSQKGNTLCSHLFQSLAPWHRVCPHVSQGCPQAAISQGLPRLGSLHQESSHIPLMAFSSLTARMWAFQSPFTMLNGELISLKGTQKTVFKSLYSVVSLSWFPLPSIITS